MTPRTVSRPAVGQPIQATIVPSPLSWMLVAASKRGVTAIEFDDEQAELEDRLAAKFPAAQLDPIDANFSAWVAAMLACLDRPTTALRLPLDVPGTAFQHRVWQALQQIPPGITRTYREVAAAIGQPQAIRAVARAIASNPVAVAIPCQRVIGTNGSLTGYRWGLERKAQLLDAERGCARGGEG